MMRQSLKPVFLTVLLPMGLSNAINPQGWFNERWELLLEKSYSNSPMKREEAIHALIKKNDTASIRVLRNRLSIETNPALRGLLLGFFIKRHSREDFYHLMLFLKTSRNSQNRALSMKLLYEIHRKRLLFELSQLFKAGHYIHFLTFMQAIPHPGPEDIQWLRKKFNEHRIAKFWLSLNPRCDLRIVEAITPYYKKGFFTQRFTNHTLYWLIQYNHHHQIQNPKNILKKADLKIVESFTEMRQKKFLNVMGEQILPQVQPKEWFASSSYAVLSWLMSLYFKNMYSSPRGDWFQALLDRLKREKDPFLFRILISHRVVFSEKNLVREVKHLQGLLGKKCEALPQLKWVCFSYFSRVNPSKAYALWRRLSPFERTTAALENMSRIMKLSIFHKNKNEFSRWALFHPKEGLRHRFVSLVSKAQLREDPILFASYLKHEKKISVKMILIHKILESKELIQFFLPLRPEIGFYL